jgi:hypothetical protein
MKNWFIGMFVGLALIGCGNTTPPSPAGTWTDTAVNAGGICSRPSSSPQTIEFVFTISDPISTGGISGSLVIKDGANTINSSLSGTLTGISMTMTGTVSTTEGPNNISVSGEFNYSQKKFVGTVSGKCSPNSSATGTYGFTAIKQ